jgi:hypothetical protein
MTEELRLKQEVMMKQEKSMVEEVVEEKIIEEVVGMKEEWSMVEEEFEEEMIEEEIVEEIMLEEDTEETEVEGDIVLEADDDDVVAEEVPCYVCWEPVVPGDDYKVHLATAHGLQGGVTLVDLAKAEEEAGTEAPPRARAGLKEMVAPGGRREALAPREGFTGAVAALRALLPPGPLGQGPPGAGKPGRFQCEVCGLTVAGRGAVLEHILGGHRGELEELGEGPEFLYCTLEEDNVEDNMMDAKLPTFQDKENKTVPLNEEAETTSSGPSAAAQLPRRRALTILRAGPRAGAAGSWRGLGEERSGPPAR